MMKMTKKELFILCKEIIAATENENAATAIEFLNKEIEKLANRAANSAPTKTQKENVEVCAKIKNALFEIAKPVTITELMSAAPSLGQYSSQKISALLRQMKLSGEVVRTEEKRKAYFSLPMED